MSERDKVLTLVVATSLAIFGFLGVAIAVKGLEPIKPENCVRSFIYDKTQDIQCVAMPENGGCNRYSWTCRGVVVR